MPATTTVRIQLRSSLAGRVGRPVVAVDVAQEATAYAIRAAVAEAYPEAAGMIKSALLVVGDRILGAQEQPLTDASTAPTLTLIPPVSGG
jgi:molybdopterin converting factor small subunit